MLLAHRTLHCCFLGEGAYVTSRMSPKLDCCGETHLSLLVLRDFLLVPKRKGFPDVGTHSHLGTNALCYGKTQTHLYVLLPLSGISMDLTPLNSDLLGPDSQQWVSPVWGAIWTFQ
ncbi:hypothetical protein H1C71_032526 [Ictidomys tridecemlineatus]|nr:hypothetical protein H1C71_032526 [Ictidomys tridecemlineatus]KAG3281899.1 hypothetical protein H1C71_032526 [Ictidomys tridecemlineatus]KAG3281900.1 hypothetical protein H1C71_032526 [Ictidomys tridecemlineatus]KAG3281901.1 hypothetical protein H1C71_032526 [Ictidomys tridecemlineatus]KAG3281902.1 hypothetical protein H1C71_032526 [Ictidomys tridecemlineatus]